MGVDNRRYSDPVPDVSTVIWVGFGLLFGVALWKVGTAMLRSMTTPAPEPLPAGELRKVNVRYRCNVCGVELRLTMAPDEDPPPPKHCLEEMDVVAPLYD
ncbi:hypothetical protein BH20ACT4_BH20ACT4_02080 [soil metagenome]